MRILMVNRGIFRVPPESSGGGAEKHGYYLANHIAKLGHQVFFVSKTRPGGSYAPSVTVFRVPPRRGVIPPKTSFFGWLMKHLFGNILSTILALRVLVKERYRIQVIHCHGALAALLLSKLVGWRVPVVYTMHDASPWMAHYPGIHRRALRKLAYLTIDVPCLRAVQQVIAVCPALRDEAKRWGTAPSKAVFIRSGITIPPSRRLGPPSRGQCGLFVGQLVRRKRVDLLIEAASKLPDQDTKFLVVGDGPERFRLVQMAERLGQKDRIAFTGYVDDASLQKHYWDATFFVFPSCAEGFPLVVLEAMSHGLPVISAQAPMYKGVLLPGVNSLAFTTGDVSELQRAIAKLTSDDDLRRKLSSNAISFMGEHFSWETIARRVLSVYEEVSLQRRSEPLPKALCGPDIRQPPLTVIAQEVASHAPVLAVYLVGSRARGFGGHAYDYDVIAVMKTLLVPIYLLRLKRMGVSLSNKLGSKVEVNPLPTFRLSRAKGSLYLMKAREEGKLLHGKDVLCEIDTGEIRDISADWYFSFFSSLLKDLLGGYETSDTESLRRIAMKIAIGLGWLSRHSRDDVARRVSSSTDDFLNLASSNELTWLDIRERAIMLFRELATDLLRSTAKDLQKQTEAVMRIGKGRSIVKNLQYSTLVFLMKGEVVSPKRIFSRTAIQDRYRAGLILLSAAASNEHYDPDLTYRAYSILKGCLKVKTSNRPAELWRSLREATLEYWGFAQPVMGL